MNRRMGKKHIDFNPFFCIITYLLTHFLHLCMNLVTSLMSTRGDSPKFKNPVATIIITNPHHPKRL